jgi:hypothetical protein
MKRFSSLMGLLLLIASSAAQAGVLWGAHGLSGVGIDGNPLERIDAKYRQRDAFSRLEAGIDAQGPTPANGRWSAFVRWGSDRYVRERAETRQLVRSGLRWEWSDATRSAACFWTGGWRVHPLACGREVQWHDLGADGHLRLGRHATLLGDLHSTWLHRARGVQQADWDPGHRRGWRGNLEAQRALPSGWRMLARLEGSRIDYDRRAIARGADGQALLLPFEQQDRSVCGAVGIANGGSPALRCTLGWRRLTSNSYGVGFSRARIDLRVGYRLVYDFDLVVTGRWEPGEHRATDVRLFDPAADPDDPEFGSRDAVTLRLVRPLGDALTLELQGGWERSEARLPYEHYEKTSLLAALRYGVGR